MTPSPMRSLLGLSDRRLIAALVLAASVGVLGTAFAFQYIGGLQPCVLCLWQRYPYGIAIALSLAALLISGGGPLSEEGAAARAQDWLLRIAGLVFLVGAGIAVFHVGVEQHWWQGTAHCGAGAPAHTLAELEARLREAPVVRCDKVAWSLFGISMAGYNILLSLGLAAVSFAGPGVVRKWMAPRRA